MNTLCEAERSFNVPSNGYVAIPVDPVAVLAEIPSLWNNRSIHCSESPSIGGGSSGGWSWWVVVVIVVKTLCDPVDNLAVESIPYKT